MKTNLIYICDIYRERRKKDNIQKLVTERDTESDMLKNQSMSNDSLMNCLRSEANLSEVLKEKKREIDKKTNRVIHEALKPSKKRASTSFPAIAGKRSRSDESENSFNSDAENKSTRTENDELSFDDTPSITKERLPETQVVVNKEPEDNKFKEQLNISLKELYSLRKNIAKLLSHLLPSEIQIPPKTSQIDQFIIELINSYKNGNKEELNTNNEIGQTDNENTTSVLDIADKTNIKIKQEKESPKKNML